MLKHFLLKIVHRHAISRQIFFGDFLYTEIIMVKKDFF